MSPRTPRTRSSLVLLTGLLAWLWFFLCRQLSYEWAANEQYSYGWFVPFFAAFLFWLRWEDHGGTTSVWAPIHSGSHSEGRHGGRPSKGTFLFLTLGCLFLLLPVRLFEIANPDWRPLSWLHAFLVVGFTLLVLYSLGGEKALAHFAFPVCFILVAVPWVTPIETPIVQGLMRLVASIAAEILNLCGIPAQLEGSVIRVSSGAVGVSEACSGVRSLQTSLMIGLLFGELKRLSVARRFLLVGAALAIAFLANCARAFFLVWIAATQNLNAVERWHDTAGYAIVLAVFIGTIALAAALGSARDPRALFGDSPNSSPEKARDPSPTPISAFHLPPLSFLLCTLAFLIFTEASVNAWYRWHERNFVGTRSWSVHWPESLPGFHDLAIDDNIRSTLRYDRGREAVWPTSLTNQPNDQKSRVSCTMFFFRWNPGSASILRARAHRPDICLPNTGWRMTSDDGVRAYSIAPDFSLPFRHFRFVRERAGGPPLFAQAFFCQREDRVPPSGPDRFDATSGSTGNWMRDDRVRVVRQGLRNQGQQVLELVMIAPNEMSRETAEAKFAQLAPKLVKEEGE